MAMHSSVGQHRANWLMSQRWRDGHYSTPDRLASGLAEAAESPDQIEEMAVGPRTDHRLFLLKT